MRIVIALALLLICPTWALAATRTTLQSAATAVGNGTHMTVDDKGAAGVTITGTFTATITFEGSADGGTTWSVKSCNRLATPGGSTTTTSTGQFLCDVAGLSHFRTRISSYTDGSVTAVGTASNASTSGGFLFDSAGNLMMAPGVCLAGESFCISTSPTSYIMTRTVMLSSGQKTADAQIKASAGYVSHMTCQGTDEAATEGTIILYDSLTETGTAKFTFTVAALDYHNLQVIPVQSNFATGIYLGYTTTSDVACTVFYQ